VIEERERVIGKKGEKHNGKSIIAMKEKDSE